MTIEIGVLIAVVGLAISFSTYMANRTKSVKTDGRESAEVKAGLDYIRQGVDTIRIDLKANEKNIGILTERVTRVEESTKQAHKRIDNYDGGN